MRNFRFLISGFAILGVLASPPPADAQTSLSVQVKEGQLRATPSFLGKMLARVTYAESVDVREDRGDWKKVSLKGGKLQGWMHTSALTAQRIALKAGQTNVRTGATRDELALAGKGFNEQVESAYRKQNKALDYTWIDRMEAFRTSPDQMRKFLDRGKVVPAAERGAP